MPVKKKFDNQLTTPVSDELKQELMQIQNELGLGALTELTRRVLQGFVDNYHKRPPKKGETVPAIAKSAVNVASRAVLTNSRNLQAVIDRLSGKLENPPTIQDAEFLTGEEGAAPEGGEE
ncbi:MAG: hypothetical protein M0R06_06360 [Sphaerochaeta sp.]|nr:hypothetical protein [Sphaerochaeta sp.]